jgi:uncharacterized protein (UPF0548 family)
MTRRQQLFDHLDPGPALAAQRGRTVNFDPTDVDDSWRYDVQRWPLGTERPGPPQPDGLWETAGRLVDAYEMADPAVIRAVYDATGPLHGRDMVLEGRFWVLRFYMGVRVTEVIDERRGGARVRGWAYETLQGHLERGRMSYEVVKHEDTGAVELVILARSEGAPTLGPVVALGWRLFGRRQQLRFYRACGRRLAAFARSRQGTPDPVPPRRTSDGLVLAPSDAGSRPHHRLSIRRSYPG